MKKILFVFSSTEFYSGADSVVTQLGFYLKKIFSVAGVFPDRGDLYKKWHEKNTNSFIIPFIPAGRHSLTFPRIFLYLTVNILYSFFLSWQIIFCKVDILHINDIYNIQAMLIGRLTCRKVVVHVHAGVFPSNKIKKFILLLAEFLAHRLVFVSNSVAELWYEGRLFSPKATIIHNMYPDKEYFDPLKYAGKKKQRFVVGMVSKMCREKGHKYFIEIAKKLHDSEYRDVEYHIVGGKIRGHEAYYAEIINRINASGLKEDFVLFGKIKNVAEKISGMDVFVHTPDFPDPFPTVVLEAMMMKKPVICFRVGGIPEQLIDGESGILVSYGDVDRLADEIVKLYNNPALREKIGEQARNHVLSQFDKDKIIGEFAELYNSL